MVKYSGFISQIIEKKFKPEFKNNTFTYDESEILKDEKEFFDQILSSSFFDKQKLILISRSTDKLLQYHKRNY